MKTNAFFPIFRLFLILLVIITFFLLFSGKPAHAHTTEEIPKDVIMVLQYLLDKVDTAPRDIDVGRLSPLPAFLDAEKSTDALYQTDDLMDMPAAFNMFRLKTDLDHIMSYTLNENIPSVFFWPSSLRVSGWTEMEGGKDQLNQLREASADPDGTFMVKGEEHMQITPDQHTGAYYVYDINKVISLFPHEEGRVLLVVSRQKGPSDVGLKGWVLGKDEDWTYLYTKDTGINVSGLGWAKTYMYDSFGITLYWQKDLSVPEVICGTFSGVNAGWANMNMVKPHHIFAGMTRVSRAFKYVLENPKLPASSELSATLA
ncbi:hypothetical protein LJC71_10945, partial [Desulfosarcina sp. OttesenSCG-928-A07]|nr:hypothetical protein [Desulfosarcina sp. OttesenSCG-928-A07]